ncbi:hypothetical protein ACFP1Z_03550 [Streptomyces gamaensis]|uniref:Uncharacterized protein n=1 Tax=Streptomyces gamaensis TaxID=1763542 RepID=A0ABW0YXZ3_9ACTN
MGASPHGLQMVAEYADPTENVYVVGVVNNTSPSGVNLRVYGVCLR